MTTAQRVNVALRKVPSWVVYLIGAVIPLVDTRLMVVSGTKQPPV